MVARKFEYSQLCVRSIFDLKGSLRPASFIADPFQAFTLLNSKHQLKVKGTTKRWKIKRMDAREDNEEKNARTFACCEALIRVTIKPKMSERLIKWFARVFIGAK